MDNKKFQEALNIRFDSDAGKNITIRDYLMELLTKVWIEEEEFDGKRPFGNSGWQYDLYQPLIKYGFIEGKLDEDGYVESANTKQADDFVLNMIKFVFNGEK